MLFRFSDGATYGRFEWGTETDAVRDAYYDTAEQLADGLIDEWQAAEVYTELSKTPDGAIHGHEALGGLHQQRGEFRKARQHFDAALAAGDRLIPHQYAGEIIWGEFDNRPYLRALHGAALSRLRLGHGRAAAERIRRLLGYNPNDNTGARFLLGEALVRSGDFDAARAALLESPEHPSSWYLLGLIATIRDEAVVAATAFRRGIAANLYAAQMLAGISPVLPYEIGVFNGGYGGVGTAEEFYDDCRDLYDAHPVAQEFLKALLAHPRIAEEVLDLYELRVLHSRVNGVTMQSIRRRQALSSEMDAITDAISDETSLILLGG